MKSAVSLALVLVLVGATAPVGAQQGSPPTLDIVARASRLKPGTPVKITTVNGRTLKGKFLGVQGASLLITESRFSSPPTPQYVTAIDFAFVTSLQSGWWLVLNKRNTFLVVAAVAAWTAWCWPNRGGRSRCGG